MPNRKNLFTVAASAGMTVALTLGLFWTDGLNAKEDPNKITPKIVNPELNVQGATFSIKADQAHYDKTQEPVLTLKAHNPTDQAVEQEVTVFIQSTSAGARLSRRMVIPQSHWKHTQKVALKPGETKTFELKTGIQLPTGRVVNVALANAKDMIIADNLTRRVSGRRVAANNNVDVQAIFNIPNDAKVQQAAPQRRVAVQR